MRKIVFLEKKSKKITFKIVMSLREKLSVLYCLEGCVSAWSPVLSIVITLEIHMASEQGHYIGWGKKWKDGLLLLSLAISLNENDRYEVCVCSVDMKEEI